MHRGCEDYVKALVDVMNHHYKIFEMHGINFTVQYEKILMHAKEFDKEMFETCYIEDEYYGGINKEPIANVWGWQINDRKTNYHEVIRYENIGTQYGNSENIEHDLFMKKVINQNVLKKAIYWFIVDKTFFKRRVKEYLNRKNEGE